MLGVPLVDKFTFPIPELKKSVTGLRTYFILKLMLSTISVYKVFTDVSFNFSVLYSDQNRAIVLQLVMISTFFY